MSDCFEIKGANGQPIQIPAGEYYFNTKARARRMCGNSLSSEARQTHAAFELLTMAWQREQVKVGNRWATPEDVTAMTGLSKQNHRRAVAELEGEGLAKRVPIDPHLPLQKGNVGVLSWAEPRTPEKEFGSRARLPNFTFCGEGDHPWKPFQDFLNRSKIRLPEDLTPKEFESALDYHREIVDEIARNLKKAQEEAARLAERVCAQARINKEERTEITSERIISEASSSSPVVVEETPPATRTDDDEPKTNPQEAEALKLSEEIGLDLEGAKKLLRDCRARNPRVQMAVIVELWRKKWDQVRPRNRDQVEHVRNWTGLLLTSVPNMIPKVRGAYAT